MLRNRPYCVVGVTHEMRHSLEMSVTSMRGARMIVMYCCCHSVPTPNLPTLSNSSPRFTELNHSNTTELLQIVPLSFTPMLQLVKHCTGTSTPSSSNTMRMIDYTISDMICIVRPGSVWFCASLLIYLGANHFVLTQYNVLRHRMHFDLIHTKKVFWQVEVLKNISRE